MSDGFVTYTNYENITQLTADSYYSWNDVNSILQSWVSEFNCTYDGTSHSSICLITIGGTQSNNKYINFSSGGGESCWIKIIAPNDVVKIRFRRSSSSATSEVVLDVNENHEVWINTGGSTGGSSTTCYYGQVTLMYEANYTYQWIGHQYLLNAQQTNVVDVASNQYTQSNDLVQWNNYRINNKAIQARGFGAIVNVDAVRDNDFRIDVSDITPHYFNFVIDPIYQGIVNTNNPTSPDTTGWDTKYVYVLYNWYSSWRVSNSGSRIGWSCTTNYDWEQSFCMGSPTDASDRIQLVRESNNKDFWSAYVYKNGSWHRDDRLVPTTKNNWITTSTITASSWSDEYEGFTTSVNAYVDFQDAPVVSSSVNPLSRDDYSTQSLIQAKNRNYLLLMSRWVYSNPNFANVWNGFILDSSQRGIDNGLSDTYYRYSTTGSSSQQSGGKMFFKQYHLTDSHSASNRGLWYTFFITKYNSFIVADNSTQPVAAGILESSSTYDAIYDFGFDTGGSNNDRYISRNILYKTLTNPANTVAYLGVYSIASTDSSKMPSISSVPSTTPAITNVLDGVCSWWYPSTVWGGLTNPGIWGMIYINGTTTTPYITYVFKMPYIN